MGDSDFDRAKRVMGGYKHDGSKGPKYTRWKERFLDDAQGRGDDDWSMADTLMGTDGPQGGIGAAAAKARVKRRRQAFSELMNSLDDDSCRDLKTEIRANANGNGKGAWAILERECGETASTLDDGTKVAEWWQLSMEKDTGINADSVMLFNRLLTAKNSKLQVPFSGDDCTEKFLQSIKRPATLATEAQAMLDSPAIHRHPRFYTQAVAPIGGGPAVPAGWNRTEVVGHFDTMWRVKFAAGDAGQVFQGCHVARGAQAVGLPFPGRGLQSSTQTGWLSVDR
jgi:hypothetical protein